MPADIVRIDDPCDPRIEAYRDIRERDLARRHERFVAEGKVVLDVLFDAGRFEIESVLVLENRLDGMASTLARKPDGVPVYVAPANVIDRIAGFHVHRGVLAIGNRRARESCASLLSGLSRRSLVLGLVGITNHDNMGAIFRNAAAFGAGAVILDPSSCDPLYRKAIRVSVGAALKVPFARASGVDDLIGELERNGFRMLALSPRGSREIAEVERSERQALLLGTEGEGLPERLLTRLPTARIAMSDGFDSVNVAAASAIALHHLRTGCSR